MNEVKVLTRVVHGLELARVELHGLEKVGMKCSIARKVLAETIREVDLLRQYMPVKEITLTVEDIQRADAEYSGFCISCGEKQCRVEPDARKYVCAHCGMCTVYGAAEIALCGLAKIT